MRPKRASTPPGVLRGPIRGGCKKGGFGTRTLRRNVLGPGAVGPGAVGPGAVGPGPSVRGPSVRGPSVRGPSVRGLASLNTTQHEASPDSDRNLQGAVQRSEYRGGILGVPIGSVVQARDDTQRGELSSLLPLKPPLSGLQLTKFPWPGGTRPRATAPAKASASVTSSGSTRTGPPDPRRQRSTESHPVVKQCVSPRALGWGDTWRGNAATRNRGDAAGWGRVAVVGGDAPPQATPRGQGGGAVASAKPQNCNGSLMGISHDLLDGKKKKERTFGIATLDIFPQQKGLRAKKLISEKNGPSDGSVGPVWGPCASRSRRASRRSALRADSTRRAPSPASAMASAGAGHRSGRGPANPIAMP